MKTTLDHLPEDKQTQLHQAVDIICEFFKPGLLILFGSYARGDWEEELADDGEHYVYQSDFDLIAIMKNEALARKVERKKSMKTRLQDEVATPVSLIAEDIHFVNQRIEKRQYFFTDIRKEGILLFSHGDLALAEPVEMEPQERQFLAKGDYDYWYDNAKGFLTYFDVALQLDDLNKAAFFLHQATECFYDAILLVYTRYKPKTHDLEKLSGLVASIEPRSLAVFPTSTLDEKIRFELLRKAYVDARYNREYTITRDDLAWLAERVERLRQLTVDLCREKIDSFTAS
ncbi:HEPN domain-containing protein [Saccharospirillum salsuginis]|uniref:DNA-binding protein n=1 Tax=Saccharospirillum salsuginis TaxID=418750 RepID=A0A918NI11_9GAMM|nr:HEPN domain-containing protein [Saccharospirillum salsuginis]GGX68997.1 DNA-binding protein [Saccharospirillum salsuginis]